MWQSFMFFLGPLHSFLQERVRWARAQYQRSVEGVAVGRKGNLLESKTFHIVFQAFSTTFISVWPLSLIEI